LAIGFCVALARSSALCAAAAGGRTTAVASTPSLPCRSRVVSSRPQAGEQNCPPSGSGSPGHLRYHGRADKGYLGRAPLP
jgi:hypothetical protein